MSMTPSPVRLPEPRDSHVALHDRAMENLRYIRETMERSQPFTAVSGVGGILMGLVALAAAALATRIDDTRVWVWLWMGAAAVALAVAVVSIGLKTRSAAERQALAGRKFFWNVTPPLLVGGLLTLALVRAGVTTLLPGVWLLLYGTGVVAGGAFSVRVIPMMGFAFMASGSAALFLPPGWENLVMALGFGALHIVFGLVIWRNYGG